MDRDETHAYRFSPLVSLRPNADRSFRDFSQQSKRRTFGRRLIVRFYFRVVIIGREIENSTACRNTNRAGTRNDFFFLFLFFPQKKTTRSPSPETRGRTVFRYKTKMSASRPPNDATECYFCFFVFYCRPSHVHSWREIKKTFYKSNDKISFGTWPISF